MLQTYKKDSGEYTTDKTLALAMIMKDEISDLDRIIHDYGQYFDKIYVTITERPTYLKYRKLLTQRKADANTEKLELSYFKWCDHFGKARAYNLSQVKTDYWMWIDLDDEIEGVEHIPRLLTYMVEQGLGAMWFHYNYYQNAQGEAEAILWRERLMKSSPQMFWKDVACHETIAFPVGTRMAQVPEVVIKHRKTAEEARKSGDRNEVLLEKDWQQTHSPETAYHQGTLYIYQERYEEALVKFWYAADKGETLSMQTQSLISICDCYRLTDKYDLALEATDQAVILNPEHPGPYWQKFTIFMTLGLPQLAVQFAELAMKKEVDPTSVIPQDPTIFAYRGPFAAAQGYLAIGNIERAFELYSQVKTIASKYIEQKSAESGVDWSEEFEGAYRSRNVLTNYTAKPPAITQQ